MIDAFRPLDVVVLGAYILGVTAFGMWLGRRQRSARDYFLAGRDIPWWAISFSVIATETSALTFISVPATAYTSDMWMLQLTGGYLVGRIAVAAVLLPLYFRGELSTAYQLLGERFGAVTRRFASAIFMVTRAFADSVRVFAAAIPIALITGWPYWLSILVAGVFTLIYTYYGGLRAVIWVDVIQFFLYLVGGVVALWALVRLVPGGWDAIVAAAQPEHKFRVLQLDGGPASASWLFTGLIGGAFLSMASHGVDQLIVQRLLAARSLADARRAVITSGFVVIGQFALFLVVGIALFAYYQGRTFDPVDEVFPRFIVEGLPPGLSGLIVAGIIAAMMSTVSSSLNSLASAATHDIYAPLAGRVGDEEHLFKVGRRFTLAWAVVLVGGAMLFELARQDTPIVVVALSIASFTYGGLLGGFLLAKFSSRADQVDAMIGMGVAIAAMTALWALQQFGAVPQLVNALWFALIGTVITLAAGTASSLIRGSGRAGPRATGASRPAHHGAGR
ncbi:MAG: sodium:solute symporter [Longimicrobiales bacterium]